MLVFPVTPNVTFVSALYFFIAELRVSGRQVYSNKIILAAAKVPLVSLFCFLQSSAKLFCRFGKLLRIALGPACLGFHPCFAALVPLLY